MENKNKSYLVREIPENQLTQFKIRSLQDGFSTYNEALLHLIEKYADNQLVEMSD